MRVEHGYRAVELGLSLKPDVILMDLLMPGLAGVEAIGELIRGGSTSRIVVLTSSVDDRMVLAAIRAGAFSYILKTSSAEQLAQAIRLAVAGYPTFDGPVQRVLLGQVQGNAGEQPLAYLTDWEMDVLKGIAAGNSNQEIADSLGIGIKTVKTHVSNILMKLDVQDRTQRCDSRHSSQRRLRFEGSIGAQGQTDHLLNGAHSRVENADSRMALVLSRVNPSGLRS